MILPCNVEHVSDTSLVIELEEGTLSGAAVGALQFTVKLDATRETQPVDVGLLD